MIKNDKVYVTNEEISFPSLSSIKISMVENYQRRLVLTCEEQVLKGRKENKKVLWSSRKPILFQVELDTAHFGGSIHSFG